ncbi:MAG: hypothetical protein HDS97_00625 [Bacteroidales bacterium]|nr:hypothetical protein [Bacteroidales bacterium]
MYVTPDNANEYDKWDEPRLHMERLMRVKLIEFDLSMRILLPLEAAGIKTLGDLCAQSKRSLLKINRINRVTVSKLQDLLCSLGLELSNTK